MYTGASTSNLLLGIGLLSVTGMIARSMALFVYMRTRVQVLQVVPGTFVWKRRLTHFAPFAFHLPVLFRNSRTFSSFTMGQVLQKLLDIFYTKKLDIVVIGLENR
jgi:hypothetical protein